MALKYDMRWVVSSAAEPQVKFQYDRVILNTHPKVSSLRKILRNGTLLDKKKDHWGPFTNISNFNPSTDK